MWRRLVVCPVVFRFGGISARRSSHTPRTQKQYAIDKLRNIGIIAHIDAGKTTTTERMLFYSGVLRLPGDVDEGSTVMDFMEQERDRGITIRAAATTFYWNEHQINLIDTPGHVDFTAEVERAVRVLDGAVAIFDGVTGVEAQSEVVWRQADKFNIPRVVFINKMDRDGACFRTSVSSIEKRLGATTLHLQLPIGDGTLEGVVDVLSLQSIKWTDKLGKEAVVEPLTGSLLEEAQKARADLIEKIAEMDDEIATRFLGEEGVNIPLSVLHQSIRNITLANRAVPVLCGSSLKNRGVQPLLDAIVRYLPSPLERPPATATLVSNGRKLDRFPKSSEPLSALAFKVIHDRQRGPVVFLRIYSGSLQSKASLFNVNRETPERPTKLLRIYGPDADEINSLGAGDIGAVVGFRHTVTGDTLVAYNDKEKLLLPGVVNPPPVFICSMEAPSASQQEALEEALRNLVREDPSLHMRFDEETGQLQVSGLGELHLEVLRDRIKIEFNIDATLGPMRVAYRESVESAYTQHTTYSKPLGGKATFAEVFVSIRPAEHKGKGNQIVINQHKQHKPTAAAKSAENSDLGTLSTLPRPMVDSLRIGLEDALANGVILGYAMTDVVVEIEEAHWNAQSTPSAFRACVAEAMREAIRSAGPILLEPIMKVEVTTAESLVGDVLNDLTSTRRGRIEEVLSSASSASGRATVFAEVPLSELLGYATSLRSLTRGEGSFSMQFTEYGHVGAVLQAKLIANPP